MRAAANDLMQNFRYHVIADLDDTPGVNPLGTGERGVDQPEAGFQSVTLPEVTAEAVEYREGTMMWTQKFQGPPTVSDLSLIRGVSKTDNAFYDWMWAALQGKAYRATVTVHHYQRAEYETDMVTGPAGRTYECYNCLPIRVKVAADLESNTGEVSLAEIDVALESFLIDGEEPEALK